MVTKMRNKAAAEISAEKQGSYFGFCVFDGKYYVGLPDELAAIGCFAVFATF